MLFQLAPAAVPADYGEGILPLVAAKAHLRVVDDEDDDLIAALRDAAIDMVEGCCGLFLARRTDLVWESTGFGPRMMLGRGPAAQVASVTYRGPGGSTVTLAADKYRLGPHGRLLPAFGTEWPSDCEGLVTVTFDAGFEDVAAEQPKLLAAVRMALTTLYDIRGDVVTGTIVASVPMGVRAICDSVRMPVI